MRQDAYDAGLTGLFLMDCKVRSAAHPLLLSPTYRCETQPASHSPFLQAQAEIAEMLGGERRATVAAELRRRLAEANASMHASLWDGERGYFVNRRSGGAVVPSMAPTNFYPLLAATASTEQVEIY